MFRNIYNIFRKLAVCYALEMKMVLKDAGVILFFCFLPLAYPVIYSLIYNPEVVRNVPMVVVDHDRTAVSRNLVRKLDATPEIWVKGYAANLGEGKRAMHSHEVYGILEIPHGFERKLNSGEQADAVLYSEMSLLLRYKAFLVASVNVASEFGSELQTATIDNAVPAGASYAVGDPMPVASIAMGNIESGFDSFIMPGVLVLILHQCIILSVGMMGGAMHEDPKKIGYDPINLLHSTTLTLIAKALCYLTIMAFFAIFLLHYIPLIFRFPMEGDVWQIFLFILPMMIACVALGFCLQALVTERETIFLIWVVTSVVFLFLSGLTWPQFAMPPVWKGLSSLVPATWGVEGFIKMNTNGASLTQVSTEYHALWILAAAYSFLAYFIHRFILRPRLRRRLLLA